MGQNSWGSKRIRYKTNRGTFCGNFLTFFVKDQMHIHAMQVVPHPMQSKIPKFVEAGTLIAILCNCHLS